MYLFVLMVHEILCVYLVGLWIGSKLFLMLLSDKGGPLQILLLALNRTLKNIKKENLFSGTLWFQTNNFRHSTFKERW